MDLSGSAVADSLCSIKHFKVFKMKDIVDCFWKTNVSKTNLLIWTHDIQLDPSGSAVAEYNMLEGWLIWIKQVKPDAEQEV